MNLLMNRTTLSLFFKQLNWIPLVVWALSVGTIPALAVAVFLYEWFNSEVVYGNDGLIHEAGYERTASGSAATRTWSKK